MLRRPLTLYLLLTLASVVPAFGQTHLTFIEGGGKDRGAFGEIGTFASTAVGIDWHLHRQWSLGVEVGTIGAGRGFASSDKLLVIPVNFYAYLPPRHMFRPFVALGYTSVMIVGIGFDAGVGLDVRIWKDAGVRIEVRGLTIVDKSGLDGFAMLRVGGVIGVGR